MNRFTDIDVYIIKDPKEALHNFEAYGFDEMADFIAAIINWYKKNGTLSPNKDYIAQYIMDMLDQYYIETPKHLGTLDELYKAVTPIYVSVDTIYKIVATIHRIFKKNKK
jgi:hypothetical protein